MSIDKARPDTVSKQFSSNVVEWKCGYWMKTLQYMYMSSVTILRACLWLVTALNTEKEFHSHSIFWEGCYDVCHVTSYFSRGERATQTDEDGEALLEEENEILNQKNVTEQGVVNQ